MGDMIQFTTWARHKNMFFEISSNALNFEIKATGQAGIFLSNKPGVPKYEVFIGHRRVSTFIRKVGTEAADSHNSRIISADHYTKLWLKWSSNAIHLGIAGETKPIVSCPAKVFDLKFVAFSTLEDDRHPVHWRIELPPKIERPPIKPVIGGDLYWTHVDCTTPFPDDAFIGGFEKENLYIIRAPHRGSLTPGKFVSSEGLGYIPWGGDANITDSFDILCGFNCKWVPTEKDQIPIGAVLAGHSENSTQEKLFIGRAKHLGHLVVGKVQPSHKVCYIPFAGKEVANVHYEVLVVPGMERPGVILPSANPVNETDSDGYSEDGFRAEMYDEDDI